MNTLTKISLQPKPQSQRDKSYFSNGRQLPQLNSEKHNLEQTSFLQGVIEEFVDGILIVSEQGEWVHANERAVQICRQLNGVNSQANLIPKEIWNVCQCLIDSSLFPNQKSILCEEIVSSTCTLKQATTASGALVRIRVRYLQLQQCESNYLLVTIENRSESVQNLAIAEAKKYNFTAREKDVWSLYRAKYSYKAIAATLYISLNTVKKHMKSIHAKRQLILANDE